MNCCLVGKGIVIDEVEAAEVVKGGEGESLITSHHIMMRRDWMWMDQGSQ